jgi:lysozyme family protein
MSYVSDHALYGLGGIDDTAQALLTRFGISWNNSVRALYYVNMNVGTTDFGSDAVKVLVQAVQAGMKSIGRYKGPIDGSFGIKTQDALNKLFPNRWRYMTWYDVLNQIANRSFGIGVKQRVASVLSGLGDAGLVVPPTVSLSSFKCVNGVCTGLTSAATQAFKSLQTAAGVSADGKIGPATAKAVYAQVYATWLRGISDAGLAQVADAALKAMDQGNNTIGVASYADQLRWLVGTGASAAVAKPVSTPSVPRTAGISTTPALPAPPSGGFMQGGFAIPEFLKNPFVIAGGVFVGLIVFTKMRKKAS